MDIDILRIIWFILIGVLFTGYSILDGFDLGVGCLIPLAAKSEKQKRSLFNAISPFWDGNEVWLLTAGGALFAAFPHAYATVFSGFYLALMIVLFALIFRAVSIEFYKYDEKRKKLWFWAFVIGSFIPSLLFGVALGNVIVGVPLNEKMDYAGNFLTLLRPYPLSIGIFGLVMILYHGANFIILKTDGEVKKRALIMLPKLRYTALFMLFATFCMSIVYNYEAITMPLSWLFCILFVFFIIINKNYIKDNKDWRAFLSSSAAFSSLWGIVGAIHFPNLVKSNTQMTTGISNSLTIFNASSSELTLKVMTIIALIGMPIVIGYSILVYRIFKEKVGTNDDGYY